MENATWTTKEAELQKEIKSLKKENVTLTEKFDAVVEQYSRVVAKYSELANTLAEDCNEEPSGYSTLDIALMKNDVVKSSVYEEDTKRLMTHNIKLNEALRETTAELNECQRSIREAQELSKNQLSKLGESEASNLDATQRIKDLIDKLSKKKSKIKKLNKLLEKVLE